MSLDKPWEDFADPLAAPATPVAPGAQPAPEVGYGEDIVKGAAGGLGRGAAALAGAAGDLSEYGARGLDWATRGVGGLIGADIKPRQAQAPSYGSAAAQRTLEGITGPLYQPKTLPGQFASTIGEFAPAALAGGGGAAARAFNTVVPAVASESAGQITKGTAAEPWARGVAGIAAGPVAGKLVTPAGPQTAARRAAVDALEAEGIPLSAGQRTGSRPIQWMESTAADMPGSAGRAQQTQAATRAAYDRAITERVADRGQLAARGVPDDVSLPDPRVATAGRQSLGDEYARLSQTNQLRSDPQLQRDLLAAQTNYERRVLPSQRTRDVEATRNDIIDALVQGQGRMPGDVYQATRSQLGTNARGVANQPYLAGALRDMRSAMDRAMQRGLSPADAQAWALNNRRYANMKQLEPAVASAGENLSPARVAQTVRSGRNAQYGQQQGDLDELARAGSIVLKDLPQSGTAPRTAMQSLFNVPAALSAGAGGVLGSTLGPAGAVIGAAAPFAAARAVVSGPGQRYLGNRALPQNTRDIIAQELAQQALTQPGGIERNRREREEYEKKRKDPLRPNR